jgi:hypothetical protein
MINIHTPLNRSTSKIGYNIINYIKLIEYRLHIFYIINDIVSNFTSTAVQWYMYVNHVFASTPGSPHKGRCGYGNTKHASGLDICRAIKGTQI